MTAGLRAHLDDVESVLRDAGYATARRELSGHPSVVAETPYALVGTVEFTTWDRLDEQVFDVQAAFTRFGADQPSARNWDLYLVLLVEGDAPDTAHRALIEDLESDTRYARKFVRVAVTRDDLDRALRPLLPLRVPGGLEMEDPLGALRTELEGLDVAPEVISAAISAFEQTRTVEIP